MLHCLVGAGVRGQERDAIPGYINEGWFQVDKPGIYRGQCAELCGKDHGFMPIVVEAVAKDEFDAWLAAQKGTGDSCCRQLSSPTHLKIEFGARAA